MPSLVVQTIVLTLDWGTVRNSTAGIKYLLCITSRVELLGSRGLTSARNG